MNRRKEIRCTLRASMNSGFQNLRLRSPAVSTSSGFARNVLPSRLACSSTHCELSLSFQSDRLQSTSTLASTIVAPHTYGSRLKNMCVLDPTLASEPSPPPSLVRLHWAPPHPPNARNIRGEHKRKRKELRALVLIRILVNGRSGNVEARDYGNAHVLVTRRRAVRARGGQEAVGGRS
jgi:hypothetical protein